jgi:ABC-type antimicrobial peptide transport system permease subunit
VIPLSYNFRSIFRRRVTALATALGLGLVVFVFAAVLMVAQGVVVTLKTAGSPDNAILLRKGSTSELTSGVPRDAAKAFAANATVAQEGGKPVASPELFVIQQLDRKGSGGPANVAFRGFTRDGYELLRKDTLKLVAGRLPQPGTSEVMLGIGTVDRYEGAALGQSINKARRQWPVVGVFSASGSAFESEIWGDADQIAQAMNRSGYSSMTVRLRSRADLAQLKGVVDADPQYNLEAKREDTYFEENSGQLARFILVLGSVIAVFFAFGATLGAMITMYAQVASRLREVGTLRALGFRRHTVLISFLIESLILSFAGAAAGCLLASFLGRASFTTINFGNFTETRFLLHFSPAVAVWSSVFAVVMGLFGGILPAIRAARLPIAEATKG